MHLLKLLGPLEKLETGLSLLYKRFSEMFQSDAEASVFFYQMSVDEAAHADLVRLERRLVAADPSSFREVDVDGDEIEKMGSRVALLFKSAEGMTLEQALEVSFELENSAADQHYIAAITLSNPEATKLFKSLASFDDRHFQAFEDFAVKRGLAFGTRKTEHIEAGGGGPKQEQRPEEQAVSKKTVEIPQEFVDRIEYLYTWHKSMGYYKLLGIRDYASELQIKQSYYRMAKEFHPDLHMDFPDALKDKLNTIFSFINSAYATLSNPEKRKQYDGTLGSRGRS